MNPKYTLPSNQTVELKELYSKQFCKNFYNMVVNHPEKPWDLYFISKMLILQWI
jgi:hypothetical protein